MKQFFKQILAVIAFGIVYVSASADTLKVTIDNLIYECDTETGTTSVSAANSNITSANIQEEVTVEGERYEVTVIKPKAFYDCRSLKSVSIPKSIKSIGLKAFECCYGLEDLYFNAANCQIESNYSSHGIFESIRNLTIGPDVRCIPRDAFYHSFNLTSVFIPNSVIEIGIWAFGGCRSLSSVELPESLTIIAESAFNGCSSLETIEIPNSVEEIGGFAFSGCKLHSIKLPDNLRKLERYLFSGCTSLTSVEIPKIISEIGAYAFSDCTSITSINLPDNLQTLGESAFRGCSSLTAIDLPDNLQTIGEYAFSGCNSLDSIVIPENISSIGKYAFKECPNLKSIVYNAIDCTTSGDSEKDQAFTSSLATLCIGEKVKRLPPYCFSNCEIEKLLYNAENCEFCGTYWMDEVGWLRQEDEAFSTKIKEVNIGSKVESLPTGIFAYSENLLSVKIPATLTSLPPYSFWYCKNIPTIDLPDAMTDIGEGAFGGCGNLKSITLPSSLNEIKEKTFRGCSSLQSLNLPSSLTEIGERAFSGCSSLQSLNLPSSLTEIGKRAFFGCSDLEFINIPQYVTIIDTDAFEECTSLSEIYYDAANCTFRKTGWYDSYFPTLKKVTIGENVNVLPTSVFSASNEVFFNAINCPDINYPNSNSLPFSKSVKNVTLGDKVEKLPPKCFASTGMSNIEIPASVTSIGNGAFRDCLLKSIVFSGSSIQIDSLAFDKCQLEEVHSSSLKDWMTLEFADASANPVTSTTQLLIAGQPLRKIEIPQDITRINSYSFHNCGSLLTVTVPHGITSIGSQPFSGCTELQRVIFPSIEDFISINYDSSISKVTYGNKSKVYIDSDPLDLQNITIPSNVRRIPDYAFSGYDKLTSITIPESVEEIGKYAFSATGLTEIVLPSGIREINEGTFANCSELSKITLHEGVVRVSNKAFYNCPDLYSITFPVGLTQIADEAFSGCTKLFSITFSDVPSEVGADAFLNIASKNSWAYNKNLEIPNVNKWAKVKFGNQYSNPMYKLGGYTTVNGQKPNHLDIKLGEDEEVSSYAFFGPFESIRVKCGKIAQYAFNGCENLKNLCIDSNTIDAKAFNNCQAVENLYVLPNIPPIAFNDSFSKYDGVNLFVPIGSVSEYENTEPCWWKFLDVFESDFSEIDSIFKADYSNADSGVEEISYNSGELRKHSNDIFNLQGVCLKHNASEEDLKAMPAGIYIYAGKKIVIK